MLHLIHPLQIILIGAHVTRDILSFYRNIFWSKYCEQKCLVWRGPRCSRKAHVTRDIFAHNIAIKRFFDKKIKCLLWRGPNQGYLSNPPNLVYLIILENVTLLAFVTFCRIHLSTFLHETYFKKIKIFSFVWSLFCGMRTFHYANILRRSPSSTLPFVVE